MIIINIGSTNPTKIKALEEAISEYDFIKPFQITNSGTDSGVSNQPKSLQEIITGAKNRARNSFIRCNYSFGIESGLMSVPETKTGYMDVCICAIYDGRNYHLGMSCAFEPPIDVVKLVIEKGMDLNQATNRAGLTESEKIGLAEGIIGLLTKNRVTRKDYTKQAIQMALIHLENPNSY